MLVPRRAVPAAAALLAVAAGLAGCSSDKACTTAAATGGVGITAVDGVTDAQGASNVVATLCLDQTCRTATLAGDPSQQATLVAGFIDLPLTSGDARTVQLTVTRGGAAAPGSPYTLQIHPTPTGGTATAGSASADAQCSAPPSYVASILVDVMGAHEAPPPDAPSHT